MCLREILLHVLGNLCDAKDEHYLQYLAVLIASVVIHISLG